MNEKSNNTAVIEREIDTAISRMQQHLDGLLRIEGNLQSMQSRLDGEPVGEDSSLGQPVNGTLSHIDAILVSTDEATNRVDDLVGRLSQIM